MGDYRITIDGVGNHGCGRGEETTSPGGELIQKPCGSESCVDCIARATVNKLQSAGGSVAKATLEHWPEKMLRHEPAGPVDNLLTGARTKQF